MPWIGLRRVTVPTLLASLFFTVVFSALQTTGLDWIGKSSLSVQRDHPLDVVSALKPDP